MARNFKLTPEQIAQLTGDYANAPRNRRGHLLPGEVDKLARKYNMSRCGLYKIIKRFGETNVHHRMDVDIVELLTHMTKRERGLALMAVALEIGRRKGKQ